MVVSKRIQSLLDQLHQLGIRDEQVLDALAQVPREKFIDEAFEHSAWGKRSATIGMGQTISQPYMVARMTELLELTPVSGAGDRHRLGLSDGDSGASGASRLLG